MKNNSLAITAVVAVVVGAAAFFGGMKYQQSKSPFYAQFGNGNGGTTMMFRQRNGGGGTNVGFGGGTGMGAGMRATRGEVISADTNTITVKLQDGSSKIVVVGDSTPIETAVTAKKSDIKVGNTVNVFGTTNSDGSVTAQNVQLNPPQVPGRGATPSATPTNK